MQYVSYPHCRTLLLIASLLGSLASCALWQTPTDSQSASNLPAHAEAVFRRQNNAISQVMMYSLDEDESPEYDALLAAEKSVQSACAALNDYAEASEDGANTGLLLSARAGKSIHACDIATTELERLLRKLPPYPHDQPPTPREP